jgi:predicted choloylglycine hydrolase
MGLNKSQKKILKYYSFWAKEQKTTYFTETSNYFSESYPQIIDKMSTLLTVEPFWKNLD